MAAGGGAERPARWPSPALCCLGASCFYGQLLGMVEGRHGEMQRVTRCMGEMFDGPLLTALLLAGLTTVLISWDALRANVTRLPDLEDQVGGGEAVHNSCLTRASSTAIASRRGQPRWVGSCCTRNVSMHAEQ